MEAILIQHKYEDALKSGARMSITLTQLKKTKMINNTRIIIIVCVEYNVLREVTREKIAIVKGMS